MRVCFISRRYFPAISGMSVYAQNLLREMVALGHEMVMISQFRNDPVGTAVYGGGPPPPVPGVEVHGLESVGEQMVNSGAPADFEADLQAMVEAALQCHREKPFDLIHAQYGYPNGLAALEISRITGLPNITSIQGGDGHWVGTCCDTHKRAICAVLDFANEIIIGCESFAREVSEHHGTPLERFTIIPGAINASRFRPRANRTLGSLATPPVLLYHGRVDRRKGVLELVEAAEILVSQGMDFRLLISGIGPDFESSKAAVIERGLEARVKHLGYIDYAAVPAVYEQADIFVSPTWSEGFSNTILEAMAAGLPIVAARSIGVVDCIRHMENGVLHDVHDVSGLADALVLLLKESGLRQRLAETAFAEIQETYQWLVIAREIEKSYLRVVGHKPNNGWTDRYPPESTLADADLTCRFRVTPHLL